MDSIVPEHVGPRVDSQLTGAYAVTVVSLRAWAELVSGFASQGTNRRLRFTVAFQGSEPQAFETIDGVLALRNPATAPIRAVYLLANSDERSALITIDAAGGRANAPISIEAVSDSVDDLTRFLMAAENEAKNIATWYTHCSRFGQSISRYAVKIPAWLYLIVGAAFIGLVIWEAAVRSEWRELATKAISESEKLTSTGHALDPAMEQSVESLKHALQSSPTSTLTMSLALGAALFVGGTLLGRVLIYLFPTVEFLIGDSTQRHDLRRQRRTFLGGTVILSGIAIPLLRKAWLGQ